MNHRSVSPLVLGTAQLGMPYGVANRTGQPDLPAAVDIVRTAWAQGIREFDTAQDYGSSESVLGHAFRQLGITESARVISKIDPGLDHGDPEAMKKALASSLEKLAVPRLASLLLHNEALLDGWDRSIASALADLVSSGTVERIGVSVYSPEKAWDALQQDGINVVQIPSNILDRRFERRGILELAARKKKQVYVRSVFLQGLILMRPEELPEHMAFARPSIVQVNELARELGLTVPALALGYLRARMPEAKLLVGAETAAQVSRNTNDARTALTTDQAARVAQYFDRVDERILNPALWRR
jgi:aryl-alcohol dehydrogenase-like predicted oxidoreductase